jgi:4-hydroxybenzoate polyprenyltransferase
MKGAAEPMATADSRQSSRLLAYLQLMRFPNVFTAMADVAMGFLFTHASLSPIGVFLFLLLASSCLYTGGMVLNDVFDLEQDRRERPGRPLPSGRIPWRTAARLGWSLVFWGIAAGWAATIFVGRDLPGIVAICLAAAVVFYDSYGKRTRGGPLAMGACRAFNVVLGMSASPSPLFASPAAGMVAGGIGLYIVGITWFARTEAVVSQRISLTLGTLTALAGMMLLAAAPLVFFDAWPITTMFTFSTKNWLVLWAVIVSLIGWRFAQAIATPESGSVQSAVKTGILGIIVLDAAVVYGVHGVGAAVSVLLLLAPAILLGRWVYST